MTTPEIIIYAISALLALIFAAWVFASTFNAKANTKLLRAQVRLLGKIAEQSGVPKTDVDKILSAYFPD